MKRPIQFMLPGLLAAITLLAALSLPLRLQAHPESRGMFPEEPSLPMLLAQPPKSGGTGHGGGGRWSAPIRYMPPTPFEDAPGGTGQGGAGKGDCPAANLPFTAFVPKTTQGVQGQTIAERPLFWFYIPYQTTDNFSARFTLQDKDGNEIYQTTRPLPQSPGIISIRIPPTVKPLQLNQPYRWTLQLGCSKPEPFVSGWVKRVETPPAIAAKLQTLSAPQKAALLAENGFWFDALTVVGEARRANPKDTDITQAWVDLLTQGKLDLTTENQPKLEEIARQPIVR